MTEHDGAYKHIFSHAQIVRDLLQGFVHEAWTAHLDFDTLEKVNGHYVGDDLRGRADDIVWRLRLRNRDDWLYVYLLIEFQSRVDPWMALRILVYTGLLYQDLVKSGEVRRGARLPPVFPVVIYNGEGKWSARREMAELIEPVAGLSTYRLRQRHLVLDEGRIGEDEMAGLDSTLAEIIRLERSPEPRALREIVSRLSARLRDPRHDSLRRALVVWLNRVVLKRLVPGENVPEVDDMQEIDAMLAERVVQWTEKWKQEGLQEGLQEGRREGRQEGIEQGMQQGVQQGMQQGMQQGEAAVLERLLTRRFGPPDEATRSRIATAPVHQLERWLDNLLDARSAEEVFRAD